MVLLDVLKGFVPALVGVLAVSNLCGILAGAAAMAGHARPLFLRFAKGGKMVATAGGVVFAVAPWAALVIAVVWLVTFALSRYTSVASLVSAVALPVAAVVLGYDLAVIVFTAVAAAAVICAAPFEPATAAGRHREPGAPPRRRPADLSASPSGPPAGDRFATLVELACHDLRTPLATVSGFAKTLLAADAAAGREARFVEMIDEAAGQMAAAARPARPRGADRLGPVRPGHRSGGHAGTRGRVGRRADRGRRQRRARRDRPGSGRAGRWPLSPAPRCASASWRRSPGR